MGRRHAAHIETPNGITAREPKDAQNWDLVRQDKERQAAILEVFRLTPLRIPSATGGGVQSEDTNNNLVIYIRSYQNRDKLVTEHTHGVFIVLPHWDVGSLEP